MQLCLESKDEVNTSPQPQKASKMVLEMFKPNINRLQFVMETHQYTYE